MNCKTIQQLLRTDYLDGELSAQKISALKAHILICPKCRSLEKDLRAQQAFFEETKREKVPAHLWRNIQSAIVKEQLSKDAFMRGSVLERIRDLFRVRRPMFALGNAVAIATFVLIFAGAIIHHKQAVTQAQIEETLAGYSLTSADSFIDDFGTSVEEYFL